MGNARMAGKRSPPSAVENRNEQNMKIPAEQIMDPSPFRTHELAQSFIPGPECGVKSSQAGADDGNRMGNRPQEARCSLNLYSRRASRI